ncbi:MAG: DNA repair protein RadC [Ignavibacteria bacterium]
MLKIKDMPLDERPREKLILRGSQSLSDSELIAILLRTGSRGNSAIQLAHDLIAKYCSLGVLASASVSALTKCKGIGKDKAAMISAAFEISRRVHLENRSLHNKKITSPNDIGQLFIPLLRDEIKEHFIVVCLNSANRIIKHEIISIGNLNSSIVHPRETFKVAIDNNSANIILVHNHPSGNPEPSAEDISITRKLVEAGKILDIQIFDHVIVACNQFVSFVEKRLL